MQDPLTDLGAQRDQAQRHDRTGQQADRRCRHQQRVEADLAANRLGQRCAVLPKLPEADGGQHHQHQVDPEALCQRPVPLPRQRLPHGRQATSRGERGQDQPEHRRDAGDPDRDPHAVVDGGVDADAGIGQRPGHVEQVQGADGQERRCERGRHHQDQGLDERHEHDVTDAPAARPKECRLDAPLLDEQSGD